MQGNSSHSGLSKPIFKILSIYKKYVLGKRLSQEICSKYVFRLLHLPKFQVFATKLNMIDGQTCRTIFTGVLWKSYSDVNFVGKHLLENLFFL